MQLIICMWLFIIAMLLANVTEQLDVLITNTGDIAVGVNEYE